MVMTPFWPPSGTPTRFSVVSTTIIISRRSPVSSQSYIGPNSCEQCVRSTSTLYSSLPSLLLTGRLCDIRSLKTLGLVIPCL